MIEGGWEFVWPAYGIAIGALAALTFAVVLRLRAWERRARELDKKP